MSVTATAPKPVATPKLAAGPTAALRAIRVELEPHRVALDSIQSKMSNFFEAVPKEHPEGLHVYTDRVLIASGIAAFEDAVRTIERMPVLTMDVNYAIKDPQYSPASDHKDLRATTVTGFRQAIEGLKNLEDVRGGDYYGTKKVREALPGYHLDALIRDWKTTIDDLDGVIAGFAANRHE